VTCTATNRGAPLRVRDFDQLSPSLAADIKANQKEISDCEEESAKCDWAALDDFFKKVIAFVVDDDERREVFDFDLPDRFHPEFRILENLNGLDAVLSEASSRSTDRAEVETTVAVARFGDGLRAVALRQHDEAATVLLEEVDIGIHSTSGGGTE
jgi:hypothetical protein